MIARMCNVWIFDMIFGPLSEIVELPASLVWSPITK